MYLYKISNRDSSSEPLSSLSSSFMWEVWEYMADKIQSNTAYV
jgi:hypothetical protein